MFNELFSGRTFNYDMTQNVYMKLREYLDAGHADHGIVRGMYVSNKGEYGPSPVLVIDGINLNLPKHMVDKVKMIRGNADMVQAINEGKCGFKIREYQDKKNSNVTRLTVDFYDM